MSKYIQQTFRTISATFLNFHGQPVWLISQCLTYMILRPSFSSKIFESSKISKLRKRGAISVATYCNWSLICHRLSSNSQDSRCYYIKVLEPKGARSSNSPNSFFLPCWNADAVEEGRSINNLLRNTLQSKKLRISFSITKTGPMWRIFSVQNVGEQMLKTWATWGEERQHLPKKKLNKERRNIVAFFGNSHKKAKKIDKKEHFSKQQDIWFWWTLTARSKITRFWSNNVHLIVKQSYLAVSFWIKVSGLF